MPLTHLIQFLAQFFTIQNYPLNEQGGVFHTSGADLTTFFVSRIGLALEPKPDLTNWIVDNRIDALWLHRPWQLDPVSLPPNVVVLYHHLPFDEHLTIGFNQRLATILGFTESIEVLGIKQAVDFPARPIGMIGRRSTQVEPLNFTEWCDRIADQFGGYDEAVQGLKHTTDAVAVVGAMNDVLVREAAERGASLYITGQNRKSARQTLEETGMSLVAIGHRRSEEWGLRMLANVLEEQTSITIMFM